MPQEENKYSGVITKSLESFDLDPENVDIQKKIREELTPLLVQYNDLLTQASVAVKTNDPQIVDNVITQLIAEFKKHDCSFVWDPSLPRDNHASLDFEGHWILRLHPVMVVKDLETLREYFHELGALQLMVNHLDGKPVEDLPAEKNRLILGHRRSDNTEVFLTHVFDRVLTKLSQA